MKAQVNFDSLGGGNTEWIEPTSYPSHGVTFNWNYSASSAVLIFTFTNASSTSYQNIVYVDFSNSSVIERGTIGSSGNLVNTSFSSQGFTFTLDASNKSCTLSHVNGSFSNAYIIPLENAI